MMFSCHALKTPSRWHSSTWKLKRSWLFLFVPLLVLVTNLGAISANNYSSLTRPISIPKTRWSSPVLAAALQNPNSVASNTGCRNRKQVNGFIDIRRSPLRRLQRDAIQIRNRNNEFKAFVHPKPTCDSDSTSSLFLQRGGGSEEGKEQVTIKGKRQFLVSTITTILSAMALLSIYQHRTAIASFDFKQFLSEKLDILSSKGTPGLVLYTISLLFWEVLVGITTPVETAAGMAFGLERGVPANAIGKISGALSAFLLGRYVLRDYVTSKLEGNEYMELIQHSITQHPIRVALIWRFSFLPEFMKNFGLAVLPLKTWQFVVAVVFHGLPFTVLWTFLGREMGLVVRGVVPHPSKTLKLIISGVYLFGFFVSPSLVGMWIKGLKDEQKKRRQSD